MPELKEDLKKIHIKDITVACDLLLQCGENDELYPEKPYVLKIDYQDFSDKEEYRTVIRLLTKLCRKKVTEAESTK